MKFSLLLDLDNDSLGTINQEMLYQEKAINEIITSLGITSERTHRRKDVWNVVKFVQENYPNAKYIEAIDSPDIIIEYDGNLIGIEHTRMLNEKIAKYILSTQSILDKAAKLYSQIYPDDPPIIVNIGFNESWLNLKGMNLKETYIIEEIIQYVHSVKTSLSYPYHSKESINKILQDSFNSYFTQSYTSNNFFSDTCIITPSSTNVKFNLFTFYEGTSIDLTRLQKEINKKEKKIERYRSYQIKKEEYKNNSLDEIWLLLIISENRPDTYYQVNDKVFSQVISSFDKIFIFDDFRRQIYSVK